MKLQQQPTPYYLQSALDRAIDEFARRQQKLAAQGKDKSPEQLGSEERHLINELNYIECIAQMQAGLFKYKKEGRSMSDEALEASCWVNISEPRANRSRMIGLMRMPLCRAAIRRRLEFVV